MNSKITAIAFRVAIFAALLAITLSAGNLIYAFVQSVSEKEIDDVEEYLFTQLVTPLGNATRCYYAAFVCTIVAIVLSVFARKHCSGASVVMRTISMAGAAVSMWLGMAVNHIFSFTTKFADEIRGVKDLDSLDREDFGISKWQWESMVEAIENEEAHIVYYFIAYAVTVTVFFILACTSLHYLQKNKNDSLEASDSQYLCDEYTLTNEQEYEEYYNRPDDDRYNF